MMNDEEFWDWYYKVAREATLQEITEYELGIHPLQIKESED